MKLVDVPCSIEDDVIKLPLKDLMKLYLEQDMKEPVLQIQFYKNHCYYEGTTLKFDCIALTDGEKDNEREYYDY